MFVTTKEVRAKIEELKREQCGVARELPIQERRLEFMRERLVKIPALLNELEIQLRGIEAKEERQKKEKTRAQLEHEIARLQRELAKKS